MVTTTGLAIDLYRMYSQFDIRAINTSLAANCSGTAKEYSGPNALPSYDVCPVVKKILLMTGSWENGITGAGQVFVGGRVEFKT